MKLILRSLQQVRQLRDIDRDAPRLIACQASHRRRLVFVIDVGKRLSVGIADDEALGAFVDCQGSGKRPGLSLQTSIVAIPHSPCIDTGSPSLARRLVDQGFRQLCPLVCCTSRNAAWDSVVHLGLWHGQKACSSRRAAARSRWNASRFFWLVWRRTRIILPPPRAVR